MEITMRVYIDLENLTQIEFDAIDKAVYTERMRRQQNRLSDIPLTNEDKEYIHSINDVTTKINVIKHFREKYNLGLSESKNYTETWMDRLGIRY